jgi:putative aldouronate transport system permease protein
MPAAIILALLMNEIRNLQFKKLVQTVSYLPHFVSLVVICGMLREFLGTDGIITTILSYIGVEKKNLLMVPEYYRTIHVASSIWQTVGWNTIIYMSALAAIDQEQYEAAELDGAGRFQKMRYITLPSIVPTITIMFIMKLGQVLSVGYEKILLLSNTVTQETADVISSYVYRMGIASSYPQYSYSAAVGLFTSVINLMLVIMGNKICRKLNGSGLW